MPPLGIVVEGVATGKIVPLVLVNTPIGGFPGPNGAGTFVAENTTVEPDTAGELKFANNPPLGYGVVRFATAAGPPVTFEKTPRFPGLGGAPFPAKAYTLPDNPTGERLNAVKLPLPPGTGVRPAMTMAVFVPPEESA